MRRVKSAPAHLCALVHRKACTALNEKKTESVVAPALEKRTGEADAMNEVVSHVAPFLEINDSTEQLFFYMLLRVLVKLDEVVWTKVLTDVSKRLFVSFVTKHVMDYFLQPPHVELAHIPL